MNFCKTASLIMQIIRLKNIYVLLDVFTKVIRNLHIL